MPPSARESYQAAEITTASPHKLQLLLIEAALRSAQCPGQQWRDQRPEEAFQSLLHAQAVVTELLRGVDQQSPGELNARAASVYAFIFRRLAEVGFQRDDDKLGEAIRLLEFERETWRQVCQQARDRRIDPAGALPPPAARTALPSLDYSDSLGFGGLSLEA